VSALRVGSAWVAAALALFAGTASPQAPAKVEAKPVFVDVTRAAGLRWGIDRIATRGFNLVETMGGGGGFVDYDGDGLLDIYLVSYSREPQAGGKPVEDALYHNNGDGTFTDVTANAGIRGGMRGMGLAVGDYDNDGRPDLYVSGYGAHRLWQYNWDGTFSDATARAGLDPPTRWGSISDFLDFVGTC